jgi:hypothetical protein
VKKHPVVSSDPCWLPRKHKMKVFQSVAVIYFSLSSCIGQQDDYPEYQDYADSYQQDNLYADYAERQEMKERCVLLCEGERKAFWFPF